MRLLIYTLLLLSCLGFSCSNKPAGKSWDSGISPSQTRVIRLTCQPSVEVNTNDSLILRFAERPGRGYNWILATPDTSLTCLKSAGEFRLETVDLDDPEQPVEFRFQAVDEGEEILIFRYLRPWELTKPAFDSCRIAVTIR
ncbi:MAG: protease inhibitor I42 family protein [Bacteroidota bacterium]|jgi:predicted secreted protein|nr:protease inhibitor I42 family protein [Prolixibacteraceae bacterium]MDI9563602.1 protease inhibitor I42 family protein [Bacteroidota bacterium]NLT00156.1 protease inhibitor I42 family protein [Bacteroidales bacterium]OQB79491.1 MAG: Chagasin family peptidase inhibitor I42 [Bacteroidetes bacterium ADurb.Bin123]HNZ69783.1 protease inhibitor I42 family protein [Prolixibacteraceae bacterium]